jgi:hypothetical protein
MKILRQGRGTAGDVRVAYLQLLREARHCGWQTLLVGSGLWLEIAICTENFVADWAAALEHQRLRPEGMDAGHRGRQIVSAAQGRLIRFLRWLEPRARLGRRLAERIDRALLERRGLAGHADGWL